jgi:hypothetical protein
MFPVQALEEALTPRLKLSGDMGSLEKFGEYFQGKNLAKGTDVVLLWRAPETLEVVVAAANADLSGVRPFSGNATSLDYFQWLAPRTLCNLM